ncbi:MAG: single-strand DNA-binding protein [Bacteroidetes bacterium]|nr:MAG: single-strand DNA-binding protein [Bacteroidota bacterium]
MIMNTVKNKVQLVGNVGMTPELRDFNNGRKVARFSIATHDYYKNAAGERVQQTHWFMVVAWNGLADTAMEKLQQKGTEVAVNGKLISRSYQDKNGQKRTMVEVLAGELLLVEDEAKAQVNS